jgi:hypothetical protein
MIVLPKVRLTPRALEKIAEALVADGCGGPQPPKSTRLTFEVDIV